MGGDRQPAGPRRGTERWLRRTPVLAAAVAIGVLSLPASGQAAAVARSPAVPRSASSAVEAFRTPIFLLPLYHAAEQASGVPWTVLAAINEIETDYGRVLAVSPAGAVGWMQFMPATWRDHGLDADGDRRRDPWDRADAIFAAASYLRAAGAADDLPRAIFAYNHAGWYVRDVLARAARLGAVPEGVVAALGALAAARPPVEGPVRLRPAAGGRRGVVIRTKAGARVFAAADARVVELGRSAREGRFVVIRDAAGNTYAYDGLGGPPTPAGEATAAARSARGKRLFAHPRRRRAWHAGGREQLLRSRAARRRGAPVRDPRLHIGAAVRAGALLGVAAPGDGPARLRFAVRPSGRGAPWIDPAPLLAGWAQAERDGDRRAIARSGAVAAAATAGLRDARLEERVLADPRIRIYGCGRADVARGLIDRRVLGILVAMADAGLWPTVSSLECGHALLTASGNVSEHSVGSAVDIAAVNGVPIAGHQQPGGIAERTVRWLIQRPERPHQVISLLSMGGASMALPDHDDHIHVGFHAAGATVAAPTGTAALPASAWRELLARVAPLPADGRP